MSPELFTARVTLRSSWAYAAETVYLDSLPAQAKRMAVLMYRLGKN